MDTTLLQKIEALKENMSQFSKLSDEELEAQLLKEAHSTTEFNDLSHWLFIQLLILGFASDFVGMVRHKSTQYLLDNYSADILKFMLNNHYAIYANETGVILVYKDEAIISKFILK